MKKEAIVLILAITLILIGCTEQSEVQPVCNKPYILVGTECCLDTDDNSICDSDEIVEVVEPIDEVELPDVIPEETVKEDETVEETEKTTSGEYGDFVSVGGSNTYDHVSRGCGDGVCSTKEDCKTCFLDCGCTNSSICLKSKEEINSCYTTVDSSEEIEIWLEDGARNQIINTIKAKAGNAVDLRLNIKNKKSEQYSCMYWVMKDNIKQKRDKFSISSYQTWQTIYQETEPTFIADGLEKEIDLRFAVQCVGNINKLNETMYLDQKVIFIPE